MNDADPRPDRPAHTALPADPLLITPDEPGRGDDLTGPTHDGPTRIRPAMGAGDD